jgi:hypothetical protein
LPAFFFAAAAITWYVIVGSSVPMLLRHCEGCAFLRLQTLYRALREEGLYGGSAQPDIVDPQGGDHFVRRTSAIIVPDDHAHLARPLAAYLRRAVFRLYRAGSPSRPRRRHDTQQNQSSLHNRGDEMTARTSLSRRRLFPHRPERKPSWLGPPMRVSSSRTSRLPRCSQSQILTKNFENRNSLYQPLHIV